MKIFPQIILIGSLLLSACGDGSSNKSATSAELAAEAQAALLPEAAQTEGFENLPIKEKKERLTKNLGIQISSYDSVNSDNVNRVLNLLDRMQGHLRKLDLKSTKIVIGFNNESSQDTDKDELKIGVDSALEDSAIKKYLFATYKRELRLRDELSQLGMKFSATTYSWGDNAQLDCLAKAIANLKEVASEIRKTSGYASATNIDLFISRTYCDETLGKKSESAVTIHQDRDEGPNFALLYIQGNEASSVMLESVKTFGTIMDRSSRLFRSLRRYNNLDSKTSMILGGAISLTGAATILDFLESNYFVFPDLMGDQKITEIEAVSLDSYKIYTRLNEDNLPPVFWKYGRVYINSSASVVELKKGFEDFSTAAKEFRDMKSFFFDSKAKVNIDQFSEMTVNELTRVNRFLAEHRADLLDALKTKAYNPISFVDGSTPTQVLPANIVLNLEDTDEVWLHAIQKARSN